MAGKEHRKKTKGGVTKKKDKQAAAQARASGQTGNNAKAFIFASRGKAKLQQRRSAEKQQRRLHGEREVAPGVSELSEHASSLEVLCGAPLAVSTDFTTLGP